MFGACAIVPVRKDQGESGLSEPFVFAVGEVDINDYLGCVVEVAELGLPNCKVVGVVEGIAVFVGHCCVLGQCTVGNLHNTSLRLLLREELEGIELLLGLLVSDVEVSLGESTSLYILACQSHVVPLGVEGEEGQGLAGGPV